MDRRRNRAEEAVVTQVRQQREVTSETTLAVGWARVRAIVRLGRPKFLLQSAAAVGMGMTIAAYDGHSLSLFWYVWALLAAWCTHLMVHYCNEYFDLDADRLNISHTEWTGGSRVLVRGLVRPEDCLGIAFVLLFGSLLFLSVVPDTLIRVLAVVSLALAWFYTAPPVRLNYRGLGEVTTAVALYGMGPVLCYYLQARTVSVVLVAIVAPIFLFQVLRQVLMNLSDIEGDRLADKRTMAVIIGPSNVIRLYIWGQVIAHCLILLLSMLGALPTLAGGAMLLTCPLPFWVSRLLLSDAMKSPIRANSVTFLASIQLPASVCAAMSGLVTDAILGSRTLTGWVGVCATTVLICCAWVAGRMLARPRRRAVLAGER